MRDWLIKVLGSLGSSTSSYAGRPATSTELSLVTVVVGSRALTNRSRLFWRPRRRRGRTARLTARLIGGHRAVGGGVLLARPGPDILAIPDDVVLAVGAQYRQAGLVRRRISHSKCVSARNQGGQFRIVLPARPWNGWNPEIGAFHNGA